MPDWFVSTSTVHTSHRLSLLGFETDHLIEIWLCKAVDVELWSIIGALRHDGERQDTTIIRCSGEDNRRYPLQYAVNGRYFEATPRVLDNNIAISADTGLGESQETVIAQPV
jgi:hypothetical protein